MKKIILLLLLVLVSVSASARKSYITVHSPVFTGEARTMYPGIIITGDMPDSIEGFLYSSSFNYWYNECEIKKYSTGEILNVLSEYGYEVEFVNNTNDGKMSYLLSKEIPSGQTQIEGDVNHDSEVNIADVNRVISLILDKLRENPKLLEELGIVQPK